MSKEAQIQIEQQKIYYLSKLKEAFETIAQLENQVDDLVEQIEQDSDISETKSSTHMSSSNIIQSSHNIQQTQKSHASSYNSKTL